MTEELDRDAAEAPLEASIRASVSALAEAHPLESIDLGALAGAGLCAIDVPVDDGGLGGGFADLVAAFVALAERDPALASAAVLGHFAVALGRAPSAPMLVVSPPVPWVADGVAPASALACESGRVWGAARPEVVVVAVDAGADGVAIHAVDPERALVSVRDPGGSPFAWASSVRFDDAPIGPPLASGVGAAALARRLGVLVAAEAVALGLRALGLADGVDRAAPSVDRQRAEFRRADMATRLDAARLLATRAADEARTAPSGDADAMVVEALLVAAGASTESTLAATLAVGASGPAHLDEALALHAEALRLRALVARDDELRAALALRLAKEDG